MVSYKGSLQQNFANFLVTGDLDETTYRLPYRLPMGNGMFILTWHMLHVVAHSHSHSNASSWIRTKYWTISFKDHQSPPEFGTRLSLSWNRVARNPWICGQFPRWYCHTLGDTVFQTPPCYKEPALATWKIRMLFPSPNMEHVSTAWLCLATFPSE